MIIKSKSVNYKGCIKRTVNYLFREDKSASLLHTRFLPRDIDIDDVIQRFEHNERKRIRKRIDSTILFHDIISFHAKDAHKLQNDEMLRKIARKYSLMRDSSITLCVLHREQAHIHIHVLASGCRLDGRSARVSKADFKKKKLELERFQQRELRLVHSRVKHEKTQELQLNHVIQEIKRTGRIPEKERLAKRIDSLIQEHKIKTPKQLKMVLKQNGITCYERKGILMGIWNERGTRKYRLRNLGFDIHNIERKREQKQERKRNRKR